MGSKNSVSQVQEQDHTFTKFYYRNYCKECCKDCGMTSYFFRSHPDEACVGRYIASSRCNGDRDTLYATRTLFNKNPELSCGNCGFLPNQHRTYRMFEEEKF